MCRPPPGTHESWDIHRGAVPAQPACTVVEREKDRGREVRDPRASLVCVPGYERGAVQAVRRLGVGKNMNGPASPAADGQARGAGPRLARGYRVCTGR